MAKETTSLKRAYCPKCKSENELDHIFYVSPDADVCYCPNCMNEFDPKLVIDNYNFYISQLNTKAERLLYRDTKFYEAYRSFGHIIEIDPSSYRARFGRILSLIFMSTLRKTQFKSASLLLQTESETYFRKLKDQTPYAKFLFKMSCALDEYSSRFYKKLMVKDRFYSADCIELYFNRLYEIITLKKLIVDELNKSFAKSEDGRTADYIKTIEVSIDALNDKFEQRVINANGNRYKVAKVMSDGKIIINRLEESVNPITGYIKRKLDDGEKKGRPIKEKVYPDNSSITSLIKTTIPLLVLFAIIGGICVADVILIPKFKLWFIIGASAAFAVALLELVLFIVWKVQLSKRRHLID